RAAPDERQAMRPRRVKARFIEWSDSKNPPMFSFFKKKPAPAPHDAPAPARPPGVSDPAASAAPAPASAPFATPPVSAPAPVDSTAPFAAGAVAPQDPVSATASTPDPTPTPAPAGFGWLRNPFAGKAQPPEEFTAKVTAPMGTPAFPSVPPAAVMPEP